MSKQSPPTPLAGCQDDASATELLQFSRHIDCRAVDVYTRAQLLRDPDRDRVVLRAETPHPVDPAALLDELDLGTGELDEVAAPQPVVLGAQMAGDVITDIARAGFEVFVEFAFRGKLGKKLHRVHGPCGDLSRLISA